MPLPLKTIKVDCSPELDQWFQELQPELSTRSVDVTLPASGFVERIDLVLVGPQCQEPLTLARSISDWLAAPFSIFVTPKAALASYQKKFRCSPGIGNNILLCPLEKEDFSLALLEALQRKRDRIELGFDQMPRDTLINPNLSSRWLLNRLLKEIPEYIYFKDTKCRFLAVSDHLARSTGLQSGSQAIGKTDYELFDSDHAQQAEADELALVNDHVTHIDKEEFVIRKGNEMWVQSYKLPLKSPSGYPLGTFGISRDITQKKILLDEQQARHKQLSEEMELARLLQKSLLNRQPPRFTDATGRETAEFAVKHVPSTKLSGDFYSIQRTPSGYPAVFLADVMGHGASAAMVTAMLYATINEISHLADDPQLYMGEINSRLHSWLIDTDQFFFASGVYCIFETDTRHLHFCQNGGSHVKHAKGNQVNTFDARSSPINSALGINPQGDFETHRHNYHSDDEFLFFTDGIIEATNPHGEAFEGKKLGHELSTIQQPDPKQKIETLYSNFQAFTAKQHQEDDICLVLAKVH